MKKLTLLLLILAATTPALHPIRVAEPTPEQKAEEAARKRERERERIARMERMKREEEEARREKEREEALRLSRERAEKYKQEAERIREKEEKKKAEKRREAARKRKEESEELFQDISKAFEKAEKENFAKYWSRLRLMNKLIEGRKLANKTRNYAIYTSYLAHLEKAFKKKALRKHRLSDLRKIFKNLCRNAHSKDLVLSEALRRLRTKVEKREKRIAELEEKGETGLFGEKGRLESSVSRARRKTKRLEKKHDIVKQKKSALLDIGIPELATEAKKIFERTKMTWGESFKAAKKART
jgi:hypothetical protein